jgi:hypothetical protein
MTNQETEKAEQTEKVEATNKENEQFGCPCGKNYSTYDDLYLHVKTKHNGKVHLSNSASRKFEETQRRKDKR